MSSTLRLSEVARHIVIPAGIASTGWADADGNGVCPQCAALGWTFDGWQDGAGRLMLARTADGLYAADTVVMSIPRQVGKTTLVGAVVFALCLIEAGLTVIWTAHHSRTSAETFKAFRAMAARDEVAPHVARVDAGNGREGIYFANGSRVLFGAREHGFGLGFAGVGVLVLDEGQKLSAKAMDNLVPTTNAHPNPLILVTGTPPRPTDDGEVFTRLRAEALAGETDGTLYIEISADADADPDDRAQWAKANPSFPHRTGERAILRMRKNLSPESFRREALGIWDETVHASVITAPAWKALTAAGVLPDVPADAIGVDASAEGAWYAAGCWVDGDSAHVELLPLPSDTTEAADLLAARCGRRLPVALHGAGPGKALAPLLAARRVDVKVISGPDMASGCGLFLADLAAGRITHAGQERLTKSLLSARTRPYGTAGAQVWDFAHGLVSPVVAATLARLLAARKPRRIEAVPGEPRTRTVRTGRVATVL